MKTEIAPFYSISIDDRPGELARFSEALSESKVDLNGLWGFGIGEGKAQVIVVPKNESHFQEVADKAGMSFQKGTCFHIKREDRVGALCELLHKVAKEGINLHAVDAIAVDGQVGCYVWSEEKDIEKVRALINK